MKPLRTKINVFFVRATSDGLVSWSFLLFVVLLGATIGFVSRFDELSLQPWQTVVVLIVTALLMFVFLWAVWFLVLRHLAGKFRVVLQLVTYVAAGLLRAWLNVEGLIRGVPESVSLRDVWPRGISYAVSMVLLLAFGTYLVATFRLYRKSLGKYQQQQLMLVALRQQSRQASEAARQRVTDQVELQLLDELDALRDSSAYEAKERVHVIATELVQPWSQQLAVQVPLVEVPDFDQEDYKSSRRTMLREYSPQDIKPVPVAVLATIWLLSWHFWIFHVQEIWAYVLGCFVMAVCLWAWAGISKSLWSLCPTWMRWVLLFAILVIATIPPAIVVGLFAEPLANQSGFVWTFVAQGVVVTAIATFALYYSRAINSRQSKLDVLTARMDWAVTRTRGVIWCENRLWSKTLHGPVQTHLFAAIHGLSQRGQEATSADVDEIMQQLVADCADAFEADKKVVVWSATVDSVEQVWSNLAQVSITASPLSEERLQVDPIAAAILSEIVNTAFSDAIVVRQASRVEVSLELVTQDVFRLQLADDGQNPVGSAALDQATIYSVVSSWDHRVIGGSNTLAVKVPTARV